MELGQLPVTTFDRLLRELIRLDLLIPLEGADGQRWQLSERAEERINQLALESDSRSVEHLVYLDRPCGICGLRRLTRMRDSHYVCEACWEDIDSASSEPEAMHPDKQHWVTPWRQRTA